MSKELYYTHFSSISSCNSYDIFINLNSGYYQIESQYGNLKFEGCLAVCGDLRNANHSELNNYAYNVITEFYDWSDKIHNNKYNRRVR